MTRPHPRRRGYLLVEMIITLAMIGVVATLATQLVFRLLTTARELSDGERARLAIDRAAGTLRSDVQRAGRVVTDGDRLRMDAIVWTVDDNVLVRTDGGSEVRYPLLPGHVVLGSVGPVITLRVDEAEWAFAPIVEGGGR
ncbi:MAG TPA: type II secretion system protein [Tepidisphaeraceae bacterium]|jgi:prepilin-type N-terminal cleavage/methylation domain-containing protein